MKGALIFLWELRRNGSGAAAQLNVADILYTGFACAEYEQSVRQLARTHIEKPAP